MTTAPTDYFAVLQLPAACEVDTAQLERNYRLLQSQWHPDRFAGAAPAEKLAAVQMASLVNDAHVTLKSPLARAAHLLQLHGCDVGSHAQTDLEPAFLFHQIELRDQLEALATAGDEAGLATLAAAVEQERDAHWRAFTTAVDANDFALARRVFYKLQFTVKLQDEIRAVEDRLLGY